MELKHPNLKKYRVLEKIGEGGYGLERDQEKADEYKKRRSSKINQKR